MLSGLAKGRTNLKLAKRTSAARLLLAALGLCGALGHSRTAQADEPKPAAIDTSPLPRVFDGKAGFARLLGFSWAAEATIVGIILAVQSSQSADRAAELSAPLARNLGVGACRKPLAANAVSCSDLTYVLAERDDAANVAMASLVFAGVASAAATASIWLWRTPGSSYWIPDLMRVTPTVGPKSGGVILQGSW